MINELKNIFKIRAENKIIKQRTDAMDFREDLCEIIFSIKRDSPLYEHIFKRERYSIRIEEKDSKCKVFDSTCAKTYSSYHFEENGESFIEVIVHVNRKITPKELKYICYAPTAYTVIVDDVEITDIAENSWIQVGFCFSEDKLRRYNKKLMKGKQMKATLKLENGKEIAVDVSEETLKEIEKPVKKTGYERVEKNKIYNYVNENDDTEWCRELFDDYDDCRYEHANYYSDKTVAEKNARADTLMRKLRRFAVEHNDEKIDWNSVAQSKFFIAFNYDTGNVEIDEDTWYRTFGGIYFDEYATAQAAIEEFKDELIWYFTEYKDSL